MAKPRIAPGLTLAEVEYIAFRLAEEKLAFDEPIPPFSTRYPNILESCLATPFQRFYGITAYRSLYAKSSILFYLLIKNHPFQNGNKRIAVTTLLVFLHQHNKWLNTTLEELYKLTKWVAESDPKNKDFVIMAVEAYIKKRISAWSGREKNSQAT